MTRLSDFAGTYTSVGGGAALAGGIGRVQLKAGVEFSANLGSIGITLE